MSTKTEIKEKLRYFSQVGKTLVVRSLCTTAADRMEALEQALKDLLATIELHTDCMDGSIAREALDSDIERAEELLGMTAAEIIK